MFPFAEILPLIVEALPHYVLRLDLLLLVSVVLLLIYGQYRRVALAERRMFGAVLSRPGDQILRSLGWGIGGGMVGTLVFVVLGISLTETGLIYVWLLAILLMMVHPRFMCFAYGGGIVALSSLLFGFPQVDVGALMALIAVLHLVEAVLIHWTGAKQPTPMYVRRGDGRVVAGFMLQKFWPIPFIALIAMVVGGAAIGSADLIAMPDWWPLIGSPPDPPPGAQTVFHLFPVVAALGYGDLAVTSSPRGKARRTARNLFIYGVLLLGLAILASRHIGWAFAAALFSPLAHELVIYFGRRSEERGMPFYHSGQGAVILGVLPDSPAEAMGLRSGERICHFNGMPIRTRSDLLAAMSPWALQVEMEVEDVESGKRRKLSHAGKVPPLGVILVPRSDEGMFVNMERSGGPLARVWQRWSSRFGA